MKSYTRIFLEHVRLEVRVGFFDREKHAPSPLLVTVELFSEQAAWPDARIETIIDYDRVHAYLQTWRDKPHTALLETLAEELLDFCFDDRRVSFCRVKLGKTQIYGDTECAGVEIARARTPHT